MLPVGPGLLLSSSSSSLEALVIIPLDVDLLESSILDRRRGGDTALDRLDSWVCLAGSDVSLLSDSGSRLRFILVHHEGTRRGAWRGFFESTDYRDVVDATPPPHMTTAQSGKPSCINT